MNVVVFITLSTACDLGSRLVTLRVMIEYVQGSPKLRFCCNKLARVSIESPCMKWHKRMFLLLLCVDHKPPHLQGVKDVAVAARRANESKRLCHVGLL